MSNMVNLSPKSLYVHIPFCDSKCFYCDFTSHVANDEAKVHYTDALLREFAILLDEYYQIGDRPRLDTIFFGGGTPTVMPLLQWERIATYLRDHFTIDALTEWTVEANPGSVDERMLTELRNFGVNRLSFGAQTFNEKLLYAIGRMHRVRDIEKSVESAARVGFTRVSLDLIFGLPDQSLVDVRESVRRAVELGVRHVSVYGLKIEAGTPFAEWQQSGQLHLPEEDIEAEMYEEVRRILHESGREQYEISNFAQPGEEARHNLVYWRNQPYLAAGAGAHGYVNGMRYENVKSLLQYQQHLQKGERPIADTHFVSPREAMEDSVILGLRLQTGLFKQGFFVAHGIRVEDAFGTVISPLVERGWLLEDEEQIRIPAKYFSVASEIMMRFLGNS